MKKALSTVLVVCMLSMANPAWAFTASLNFFGEAFHKEEGIEVSPEDILKKMLNTATSELNAVGAVDYHLTWNALPNKAEVMPWYLHIEIWADGEYNKENSEEGVDFYVEYHDTFFIGNASIKEVFSKKKQIIDLILDAPKEFHKPGVGGYSREGNTKRGQVYFSLEREIDEILKNFRCGALNLENAKVTFGGTISISTSLELESVPEPTSVLLFTM